MEQNIHKKGLKMKRNLVAFTVGVLALAVTNSAPAAVVVPTLISTQVEVGMMDPTKEVGLFQIKFHLVAADGNAFLEDKVAAGNISFYQNGQKMSYPNFSSTLSSAGENRHEGSWYEILDGTSDSFILNTYLIPSANAVYSMKLDKVEWAPSPTSPSQFLELEGFQTPSVFIRGMVPEPATVTFLGLGAILTLRRRRK